MVDGHLPIPDGSMSQAIFNRSLSEATGFDEPFLPCRHLGDKRPKLPLEPADQ